MARLNGKVAVVTGGAKGIGRACAEALAEEGAAVAVCDIDRAEGEACAEHIRGSGGRSAFFALDVTSEEAWITTLEAADQTFGALHVLVNNAGVAVPGSVTEMTLEAWRRQQAINVEGVFLGVKHALPRLRRCGGGSIVNISSVAGLKGAANLSAYCASKGAVRLFTKAVALECAAARDGVRVNSVHPGIIETAIWDAIGGAEAGANRIDLDAVAAMTTPLGVKGWPRDIAAGVVYLASEESRYVTGSELVIDGGMVAR